MLFNLALSNLKERLIPTLCLFCKSKKNMVFIKKFLTKNVSVFNVPLNSTHFYLSKALQNQSLSTSQTTIFSLYFNNFYIKKMKPRLSLRTKCGNPAIPLQAWRGGRKAVGVVEINSQKVSPSIYIKGAMAEISDNRGNFFYFFYTIRACLTTAPFSDFEYKH